MRKILSLALLFLLVFSFKPALAADIDRESDAVLTAAESLFKFMKVEDYPATWNLLTLKSRRTIADETYKSISGSDGSYPKERIVSDFETGGLAAKAYWSAYLRSFDPDMVLTHSKWEIGMIRGDRAEIIITYKKSQRPAVVKLSKEDGFWRVGLVESFWTRK